MAGCTERQTNMTNFEAELNAEITEENIVSDCNKCQGTGIKLMGNEFSEFAEECECLIKFREQF